MLLLWDLSTLCVVSHLHRLLNSHGFTVCHTVLLTVGLTVGSSFLTVLTNCERIFFFQTHTFIKKQTQAAHSNATEERISSMITTLSLS